ncbi:hypothetical protein [Mycoplasmopsis fermentans]|nr:hypothetical protein [Mycoplasmopsis fermentans]ADN68929.1 hypothetical protein MFE_03270 [Mycoplasmopsis fermentans JER]ADV34352.1 Conserved Hypothetical Protein [Mycoplasmopsis fermentans M64]VEU60376.1 Uncharacterised protein [Mycoplasmopsis fermentans]VEU67518.1 Uncharacterised protein [Mesomycoplasma conjunctivae]
MKDKQIQLKPLTEEQEANIHGGSIIATISGIVGILATIATTVNGIVKSHKSPKGEFKDKTGSQIKWDNSPATNGNIFYAW